ncbi:MAG TPA: RidA family protein [Blastocatellia bacterium]|jgi:enamine deaminase RidA (YjgF/YER057c/UK114 family)|nr:RidA family protein [Blastocatellia bacterium]
MKMSVINPAALAGPTGYNNGILVEGGSLLFVAGQIGWDRERRIVSDDFADQFALALENVVAVVREAGGDATNIASMRIYVTDKKDYTTRLKDIGSAYRQIMGKHYPAMSLVEVAALVEDLAKVEIEAMAVIAGGASAGQAAPETPATGGETK